MPTRLDLVLVEQIAVCGDKAVLLLFIDKGHGLGGHAQGANLVGAGTSGEFAPGQYGQVVLLFNANATAVEQQGGWPAAEVLPFDAFAQGKNAGPFEEKVAFLGEEQAEAGEVDLLLVGFHLGEIGSVGQVQGQRGGEAVFEIQARVQVVFSGAVGREIAPGAAQQEGDDR